MFSRISLVIVVFLLLTAQACPDFTVDSEDGAIPLNLPASDFSASANRTTAIPALITCAHQLTFQSDEMESVGAAGCTKQPYKAVHRTWSWANNTVTVVVRFVPCR